MEVKSENLNDVHYLQVPRGSICFEATITATSSPIHNKYAKLTLPTWFVREHGPKIQESVQLISNAIGRTWTVEVIVYHPQKRPQVMFCGGWSAFASFNCLVEGDRLTFTLTAMSEFEVDILRSAGMAFPCISRSKRVKSSQRVAEAESPGCKVEYKPAEKREKLLSISCAHPTTEAESNVIQVAGSACKDVLHGNSSFSKSHFLAPTITRNSPLERCHGRDICTEPLLVQRQELVTSFTIGDNSWNLIDHEEKRNHGPEYKEDAPRKKLQVSLPSFFKKLTRSHYSVLEIPCIFARTYGIQLDSFVKLRWIHDEAPVYNVACTWRMDRDKTRISLTDGWKQFKTQNGLQEGQEFEFTLIADSSFVVRPRVPS